MQFYDLFESVLNYIPESFSGARELIYLVLPYVLMGCALFTSFFGLKCAGLWCGVTFFITGSTVSSYYLLPATNFNDVRFWVMFAVCLLIGVLCAYFSKYLFRAQLVISNFALVYASLPAFILFLGDVASKLVSVIVAAAMAFLNIKYKYIIVIATTSFSGSFIFWEVLENRYDVKHKFVFAIIMGAIAFAFQCFINREKLKDTYKDVKKKYKKTKDGGEKLITKLEEEVEKVKNNTHYEEDNDDNIQINSQEETICEKEG